MDIYLLIIFLVVFAFFIIILGEHLYKTIFKGFAPFIITRPKIVKEIIKRLEINNKSIIYELGCGQAGFLKAVGKKYPNSILVGIENSIILYLIT